MALSSVYVIPSTSCTNLTAGADHARSNKHVSVKVKMKGSFSIGISHLVEILETSEASRLIANAMQSDIKNMHEKARKTREGKTHIGNALKLQHLLNAWDKQFMPAYETSSRVESLTHNEAEKIRKVTFEFHSTSTDIIKIKLKREFVKFLSGCSDFDIVTKNIGYKEAIVDGVLGVTNVLFGIGAIAIGGMLYVRNQDPTIPSLTMEESFLSRSGMMQIHMLRLLAFFVMNRVHASHADYTGTDSFPSCGTIIAIGVQTFLFSTMVGIKLIHLTARPLMLFLIPSMVSIWPMGVVQWLLHTRVYLPMMDYLYDRTDLAKNSRFLHHTSDIESQATTTSSSYWGKKLEQFEDLLGTVMRKSIFWVLPLMTVFVIFGGGNASCEAFGLFATLSVAANATENSIIIGARDTMPIMGMSEQFLVALYIFFVDVMKRALKSTSAGADDINNRNYVLKRLCNMHNTITDRLRNRHPTNVYLLQ